MHRSLFWRSLFQAWGWHQFLVFHPGNIVGGFRSWLATVQRSGQSRQGSRIFFLGARKKGGGWKEFMSLCGDFPLGSWKFWRRKKQVAISENASVWYDFVAHGSKSVTTLVKTILNTCRFQVPPNAWFHMIKYHRKSDGTADVTCGYVSLVLRAPRQNTRETCWRRTRVWRMQWDSLFYDQLIGHEKLSKQVFNRKLHVSWYSMYGSVVMCW